MFDASQQFQLKLLSGTEKICLVRFPTDEEACDRARKLVVHIRTGEHGGTKRDVPNSEEADQELFEKIRVDRDGAPLEAADAVTVIERLLGVEVLDSSREGETIRVELKVFRARVVHVLRVPTLGQIRKYGRAVSGVENMRRHRELRTMLEPAGPFWDSLLVKTEGYAEGSKIPILHKDAAIDEMIYQIDLAMREPDPEE